MYNESAILHIVLSAVNQLLCTVNLSLNCMSV